MSINMLNINQYVASHAVIFFSSNFLNWQVSRLVLGIINGVIFDLDVNLVGKSTVSCQ